MPIPRWSIRAVRMLATSVIVLLALLGGRQLWIHYNVDPWTRDGRVRADVVSVTSDVDGLVTEVRVKDGQSVRTGDVLFIIDSARYKLATRQAEAVVAADIASLEQAKRESDRNRRLGPLVTTEQYEEGASKVAELTAQLEGAEVQRDLARLNLRRTTVRATVDGIVTNLDLQPGDYASAGREILALIDTDAIYVDGYFEETKLPLVRIGDRATVRLMGVNAALSGRVETIAAGIEDRERNASDSDLANINPTFSWVRLAQRIPVRIKLDRVPVGVRLIAGRTASVMIDVPHARAPEGSG